MNRDEDLEEDSCNNKIILNDFQDCILHLLLYTDTVYLHAKIVYFYSHCLHLQTFSAISLNADSSFGCKCETESERLTGEHKSHFNKMKAVQVEVETKKRAERKYQTNI